MAITRLVCSGCGAKGVSYVGIYQALIQQGLMENITDVAGTSAGSIAAALFAIGTSESELKTLLADSNFKTLLGKNISRSWITKDGGPILLLLQDHINKSIRTFLDEPDNIKKITENTQLTPTERSELIHKVTVLKAKLTSIDAAVTFSDLGLLQQCFPEKFKKLTVTAVKLPNGEIQVFNQQSTPDVEIALACRASASIPIALQPVSMILPGTNEEQELVDGGVYDITPADYFDVHQGTYSNHKENETLLLTFDENNLNENFYDDFINDAFLEYLVGDALKIGSSNLKENINSILNQLKATQPQYAKKFSFVKNAVATLTIEQINEITTGDISQGVNVIKTQISKPYTPTFYERLTRNVIMSWLSGMKLDYVFTDRKAANYEKIQTRYNNRTVSVNLGSMGSGDFETAQLMKREIVVMGYLDTLNHISNASHVEKKVDDPKAIYNNVVKEFITIYSSVLVAQGRDPQKDTLLEQIQTMQSANKSNQEIVYKLIKPLVQKDMLSVTGFALSRAVELNNNKIDHDDLKKEITIYAKKYDTLYNKSSVMIKNTIGAVNAFKQRIHNVIVNPTSEPLEKLSKQTDENTFIIK